MKTWNEKVAGSTTLSWNLRERGVRKESFNWLQGSGSKVEIRSGGVRVWGSGVYREVLWEVSCILLSSRGTLYRPSPFFPAASRLRTKWGKYWMALPTKVRPIVRLLSFGVGYGGVIVKGWGK